MRRVAGARWRVQAYQWDKQRRIYGNAFEAGSTAEARSGDPWRESIRRKDMEFDELTVGNWLHVEGMSDRSFWLNVAGVHVNVEFDRRGKPVKVLVEVDPEPGVEYRGEVG